MCVCERERVRFMREFGPDEEVCIREIDREENACKEK